MPKPTAYEKTVSKRLELTFEQKRALFAVLRDIIADELDVTEDIGELRLNNILSALEMPLAKIYYNKGVADARFTIESRLEDVNALQL